MLIVPFIPGDNTGAAVGFDLENPGSDQCGDSGDVFTRAINTFLCAASSPGGFLELEMKLPWFLWDESEVGSSANVMLKRRAVRNPFRRSNYVQ